MTSDSIYYYKHGEFRQFIQRIDDRTLSVSEILSTFREVKCLSHEFKRMTVQELTDEPSLILELSKALRKGMAPESRFKLPYKKEQYQQELIESLAANYAIDTDKAKAKIVTGHYKNDKNGQEFNYSLEVVMAPRIDIGNESAGKIEIIGNINSSPDIHGGEKYFDGAYNWLDKKRKMITSSNIRGILQECGFNESAYVSDAKKKVPSVLYINLNTPCPDWLGSAGKTHIDLRPYAADIGQTVSSLSYKMPSYHGMGYGWSNESYSDENKQRTAKSYLEDWLNERFDAIQVDPSLRYRDPLTQSGVWYRLRPVMIAGGFTPRNNWGKTREYITGLIDKLCQELFEDIEREDLGIYAKARGMMMYGGHVYPVDMDTFRALGRNGVFILVIEKEGIARINESPARDTGVALVHTGGRFTKYVKYLIEHAEVPVAILTDYDAYGIEIAKGTFSKTPRIGIDIDVIDWFQQNGFPDLTREEVEEEYEPGIRTDDEYLKRHRIELDSVAQRVGPEGFWKYIKHKIEELQKKNEKGFDYTNIISEPEPEELHPPAIDNLVLKLDEYIGKVVEDDWDKRETKLGNSKELISVKEQEKLNLEALTDKVAKDKTMKKEIIPRINKLLKELSDFLD